MLLCIQYEHWSWEADVLDAHLRSDHAKREGQNYRQGALASAHLTGQLQGASPPRAPVRGRRALDVLHLPAGFRPDQACHAARLRDPVLRVMAQEPPRPQDLLQQGDVHHHLPEAQGMRVATRMIGEKLTTTTKTNTNGFMKIRSLDITNMHSELKRGEDNKACSPFSCPDAGGARYGDSAECVQHAERDRADAAVLQAVKVRSRLAMVSHH